MWKDPIVEEVRKARENHAAKFNFDINAIIEDARQRQTKSKHPIVSLARKEQKLMVESTKSAQQFTGSKGVVRLSEKNKKSLNKEV